MSYLTLPLAAVLLVSSASGAAVNLQGDGTTESTDPKIDTDTLFERYWAQLEAGKYDEALEAAVQLEKVASNKEARAIAMSLRGGALLALKRNKQAERAFAEADTLAPQLPNVSSLQLSMALWFNDIPLGLAAIDRMIGRFPDVVREEEPELVYHLLRNAPESEKAQNEDRRIALARLGYGGEQGDGLTAGAIEILVRRGDIAGASDLLRHLDEPDQIQELLVQKRMSALWPALEAHAGPGLAKAMRSSVDAAARAYSAEPNWQNLIEYAEALRQAGRAHEAITLKTKLPSSVEEISKIDEKAGWAMNNIAFALRAAGRLDDADRLLASLNDAPIKQGGWRVSMIINRVAFLVEGGQFERALPLLGGAEESAKRDGNAYARQLVRGFQYCAYHRTGRAAEAARIRPEMIKFTKDARTATIDSLVCTGELDEAERLALEGLSDKSFETRFVRSLQRNPLINDHPAAWSADWASLRQRPAIAKEFDRLGRDLPDHLHAPSQN